MNLGRRGSWGHKHSPRTRQTSAVCPDFRGSGRRAWKRLDAFLHFLTLRLCDSLPKTAYILDYQCPSRRRRIPGAAGRFRGSARPVALPRAQGGGRALRPVPGTAHPPIPRLPRRRSSARPRPRGRLHRHGRAPDLPQEPPPASARATGPPAARTPSRRKTRAGNSSASSSNTKSSRTPPGTSRRSRRRGWTCSPVRRVCRPSRARTRKPWRWVT